MGKKYLKFGLSLGLLSFASLVAYAEGDDFLEQLMKTQVLEGYLAHNELPNSLVLLPPPPKQDALTHQNDVDINKKALALKNTARWKQGAIDSNLLFPKAADVYSCAANVEISQKNTPTLYKLLQKSMVDIGTSPYKAKEAYQRTRPFIQNGQDICNLTEQEQKQYGLVYQEPKSSLAKDGSYPSGHSAIGWGWALIMSEVVPQRKDHILLRGRTFAESRVVCNIHWQSDIVQGKTMGAATVALLHSNQDFLSDIKKAKQEVAKAQRLNKRPDTKECAREQDALATTIEGVI